ncbi:MAG TPA: CDP-alcohol phosphatidyltransferase family protein [Bacteroidota bacterium]|nr:CDP-alcohol phosphatidyltransferase family protein [Bacteroidota bacterium]
MKGTVRTLSNALSLLRILLAIPITFSLLLDTPDGRAVAIVLILAAGITDFLDGYVAREKGEITEMGKILDPVADKIAVGAVALVLALQGRVPVWFLAAILVRDGLILAGGYYLSRKTSLVLQSNMLGKWTAGALALTLLAAIFDPLLTGAVQVILIGVSSSMIAASSVSYALRFFSALPGTPARRE